MVRNSGTPTPSSTPSALRASAPGWRDPRLWIGILIVTASVLLGAQVVGAADDTVGVWAVPTDQVAGDRLDPEELVLTRVRFADSGAAAAYLTVTDTVPSSIELTRTLAAGELLPRAAIGAADADGSRLQLPLAVDAQLVPPSVTTGSVVDVYVGAGAAALVEVPVVEAPTADAGFAATGRRQLVVAVDDGEARRYFRRLDALDDPVVTVVRRG